MERSFGQMLSHVSKKKLCFGWPRNAIKEEKLLDKASDRADAYAATLSTSVILSDTDRKNSAKRHHSSRKGPCNPREPSRQLFEGRNEAIDVPVETEGGVVRPLLRLGDGGVEVLWDAHTNLHISEVVRQA